MRCGPGWVADVSAAQPGHRVDWLQPVATGAATQFDEQPVDHLYYRNA